MLLVITPYAMARLFNIDIPDTSASKIDAHASDQGISSEQWIGSAVTQKIDREEKGKLNDLENRKEDAWRAIWKTQDTVLIERAVSDMEALVPKPVEPKE